MEAPGFWDDPDKSNKAMKELKTLKDSFEGYNSLKSGLEDINTLIEMADEMQDDSLISEIEDEITVFEEKMDSIRTETLLSGEYDKCNAILTLHAGAGGTEAVTGVRCFLECIRDGQKSTAIQRRQLIILKAMRLE